QRGERFKSIITEEYRHVNPKYGHQSVEKNCCRWLCFSNHLDALPFDNKDRRVVVTANPKERKSTEYYARLYGLLGDRAYIGSVRRYLETLDISAFRPGEHAPMNDAKAQALNEMLNEVERAVVEFMEDCTTDLTSREAIKDYVTKNGSIGVNDNHLTHAIRRAGMTSTGKRVRYKIKPAYGNELIEQRCSVVIVRGPWTVEGVKKTFFSDVLLKAMDVDYVEL